MYVWLIPVGRRDVDDTSVGPARRVSEGTLDSPARSQPDTSAPCRSCTELALDHPMARSRSEEGVDGHPADNSGSSGFARARWTDHRRSLRLGSTVVVPLPAFAGSPPPSFALSILFGSL